jgi:hypothetical protein
MDMLNSAKIAGALILFSALAATQEADAFCRTTTCEVCVPPKGGCVTDGLPLYWASSCVGYNLQQDASIQVPLPVATGVVDRAFASWANVACPGTNAPPSVTLVNGEPVACSNVEFNSPNVAENPRVGGNANIIVFRDQTWSSRRASDPNSELALTTVTFSTKTGEILDADIEINALATLSVTDPVGDGYDLESIIAHEAGHVLGIAHSPVECSGADCPTMTANYVRGATYLRSLEADDVSAICTVYPVGRAITSTSCASKYGFSGECGTPKPPDSPSKGCAIASHSAGSSQPWADWALLGVVASTLLAIQRRTLRTRGARKRVP